MSLFDTQRFLEEQEIKASQPPITLPQANLPDPMEGRSVADFIFGAEGSDAVFSTPEGFPQPTFIEEMANPINLLSLMSGRGTTGSLGIVGPGMADDFLSVVRGFDKPVKTTSGLPVLGRSGAVTKVDDALPVVTKADDALPVVTKADDLPVLGKGSTTVSTAVKTGKGPKVIDAEVTDVPKGLTNTQKGALLGGGTFATLAALLGGGDTDSDETVATEEQKKALSNFYSDYLMTLPEADRGRAAAGIVAGLEARAQREADRAEYEKNVAEMKAESELKKLFKMAKQPGFRELVEAGIIGDAATSASGIDFMQLARSKGAKGSTVKAMADLLEADFKREEAESKARTAPAAPTMDKYDKAVALVNKLIADQPNLAGLRDDLIRRALGLENLEDAGTIEQLLQSVKGDKSGVMLADGSGTAVTDTLGLL